MSLNIFHSIDLLAKELDQISSAHSAVFILCDENTNSLCVRHLIESIPLLNHAEIIEVPAGEESKCLAILEQVVEELLERGADRNTLLLNVGGGVITDLGGLVGATYKRGIDFIHIPTSLMAQVDAAIGGKNGVDVGATKNVFGVFQPPKAIFIFTEFLATLPNSELLSGYAEMIKHGLIADSNYWTTLQEINPLNWNELALFIEQSAHIKSAIVALDPLDKNERKILNFGHTVGHAIESFYLQKSKPVTHGQAVAWGMQVENQIASAINLLDTNISKTVNKFIASHFGIPPEFSAQDKEILISFMKKDKKNKLNTIHMSLVSKIGKCKINCEIEEDLILRSL